MARVTNKVFAETDVLFRKCCEMAKIATTVRQASKYRRGLGTAYKFRQIAIVELKKDNE